MMMMLISRCPGCGKSVAESDDVCPHCGRDFSAPVPRKPAAKAPAPAPAEKPAPRPEERPAPAPAAKAAEGPRKSLSRCADCARPVARADKICPHCGHDLSQPAKPRPAPAPIPEKEPVKTAAVEPPPAEKAAERPAPKEEPPAETPADKRAAERRRAPEQTDGRALVDRCPGCGKPVAESDETCPHCGRDFSAPAARKPAPAGPPKPAAKVRLEEPDPAAQSAPLVPAPELDSPPAYVASAPGTYEKPAWDPYQAPKAPERPAWHWLAAAGLCVAGFAVYRTQAPKASAPAPVSAGAPAPAPVEPAPPPQPAVLQPLADAKDAAAASAAAALAAQQEAQKALSRPEPPPQRPTPPPRRRSKAVAEEEVVLAYEDPEPPATPEPARGAASTEWRIRGSIFDLVAAEPVGGADVVFVEARTGKRYSTSTDGKGMYRATLPVCEEGYDLTIRHPKYEPKYFEDGVPSYRKQDPEKRQRAAEDLMRVLQTKELFNAEGGAVLQRDFVLIPLAR